MDTDEISVPAPKSKPPKPIVLWLKSRNGKITVAVSVVVLVALGAASIVAYQCYGKKATTAETNPADQPTVTFDSGGAAAEKKVADNLDGTIVSEGIANRRPLAVMIENHPDARPQSGLDKASVVFEAIAEGGITRFEAVFGSQNADKIGPVRSARPYFVQYASGFHAIYAHAGGSEGGLALLQTAPVTNLDNTANYFWRVPKAGLASEHTLYTSSDNLYKLTQSRGATLTADIQPWKFENDPDVANRPTAQKATIDFSSASYKVGWSYDPTTDLYARTLAGVAHKDAVMGNQLTAKNVVLMTVTRHQDATANHGKGEWTMDTIGEGSFKILKHGQTVEGTWKKPAIGEMLRFYNSDGSEVSLGRGLTWVEVVPPDSATSIE